MQFRELGTNGPTVFTVGYGAMVLSPGIYQQVEDSESERTLRAVLDPASRSSTRRTSTAPGTTRTWSGG